MTQETYVPAAFPNILLVEDEFLIRMLLSENLRTAGYEVSEANSADTALTMMDTINPALIISDVRMPGSLDGMGLLAAVKKTHPFLPIIITSGHFDPVAALEAGAASFVSKPYSFETMHLAVKNVLSQQ